MTTCGEIPGAAQNGSADAAGRGRNVRARRLRKRFDESRAHRTGGSIATPQPQFAVDSERAPNRRQFLSVVDERLD